MHPHRMFVPPSDEAALSYRGLPYDVLEDALLQSGAWNQAMPFLLPREDVATGRPITPLHGGHVGLLCMAGLLNGVFGHGEERHIARWRSVKHVTTFTEEDGDTQIVHHRERWTNELRLVCLGSMRRPDSATVASIESWERGFYESAFTHERRPADSPLGRIRSALGRAGREAYAISNEGIDQPCIRFSPSACVGTEQLRVLYPSPECTYHAESGTEDPATERAVVSA
jgi:hypothetical protein